MSSKKREFTPEQLAAAQALDITPEELVGEFSFPSFIEGMGYKLKVKKAKNTFTQKGAHQVMLTQAPVTNDNKLISAGTFSSWYAYPFDQKSTGYKFPTPRDRERARRDMSFFLRLALKELNTYRAETIGTQKIFFETATGNQIPDSQVKAFFEKDRIAVLTACRAAEKDASVFEGISYYAVYSPWTNKDGEKQPGWSYLSIEPIPGKLYALDRGSMFEKTSDSEPDAEEAASLPQDDISSLA